MVIEIKHKNKILNIKLENKIEKEIVTMLSWRKATEKPHVALPVAPIFCFASSPSTSLSHL